ncbi:MAG: hypothetical protein KJ638_09090 [Chloroflexi bacterium]|nr:hypothetical protein [Chloroflexota bacterium]
MTTKILSNYAESIPSAELWLAPGVKHMLPQEIAEEFNRRMLTFLPTDDR